MSEKIVIEPATEADLDELSEMLGGLFAQEGDFRPDKDKQLRGLRLIFAQPSRGRVFVLRRDGAIVGMINLLFTISTAEGGFVILLEDLVIHKEYQGKGYGSKLLQYAIDFAKQKNFLRITLLTDRPENVAQAFFRKHGFVESSMIPMRLLITPQRNSDQSSVISVATGLWPVSTARRPTGAWLQQLTVFFPVVPTITCRPGSS